MLLVLHYKYAGRSRSNVEILRVIWQESRRVARQNCLDYGSVERDIMRDIMGRARFLLKKLLKNQFFIEDSMFDL